MLNSTNRNIFSVFLVLVLIFIILRIFGKKVEGFLLPRERDAKQDLENLEDELAMVVKRARCDSSQTPHKSVADYTKKYNDLLANATNFKGTSEEYDKALTRGIQRIPPLLVAISKLPVCDLNCGTEKLDVIGTDLRSHCLSKPGTLALTLSVPTLQEQPSLNVGSMDLITKLNSLSASIGSNCITSDSVVNYLNIVAEAKQAPSQPKEVVEALASLITKYKKVSGICDISRNENVNIPVLRGEANTWVTADGTLWLFGGKEYTGSINGSIKVFKNDLWKNQKGVWKLVLGGDVPEGGSAVRPASRIMAATWNGKDGNLWLYGGCGRNNELYSDMWKWNISTSQWELIDGSTLPNIQPDYKVPTPGTSPVPFSYVHQKGNLWLLIRNELWLHNGTEWVLLSNDTLKNKLRSHTVMPKLWEKSIDKPIGFHPMWIDSQGYIYVYVSTECINSNIKGKVYLWKWDTTTSTWSIVYEDLCSYNFSQNPSRTVGVRPLTWKDTDDNLYMILQNSNEIVSRVWKWDIAKLKWQSLLRKEIMLVTCRQSITTWNVGDQLFIYGGQVILPNPNPKYPFGKYPADLLVLTV